VIRNAPLTLNVFDVGARRKLRAHTDELGLKSVCLAGYPDFTASAEEPGIPSVAMNVIYIGEVSRVARDLGCSLDLTARFFLERFADILKKSQARVFSSAAKQRSKVS